MFTQILLHTPPWVWALLVGLVTLGYSQTRSRTMGVRRVVIMPVAMILLSLYGTVSAFGLSPVVLGAWLAACALLASLVALRTAPLGAAYDSAHSQFAVPGSWWPMLVILCIFCTKYAVGATLAMHSSMAQYNLFAVWVGALYGMFSGFFAGRALQLWRLALPISAH